MSNATTNTKVYSWASLKSIHAKVKKVNQKHYNLKVHVKRIQRKAVYNCENQTLKDSEYWCTKDDTPYVFNIKPSTYSKRDSLISSLFNYLVGVLELGFDFFSLDDNIKMGEIADMFADYMLNGVYACGGEMRTVVEMEFETTELIEIWEGYQNPISSSDSEDEDEDEEEDRDADEVAEAMMCDLGRVCWRNDQGRIATSCSICLDAFADGVEVVKTQCEHLFHDLCLRNWLRNRRNGCPMCRATI